VEEVFGTDKTWRQDLIRDAQLAALPQVRVVCDAQQNPGVVGQETRQEW
jgi:hypothetical protein